MKPLKLSLWNNLLRHHGLCQVRQTDKTLKLTDEQRHDVLNILKKDDENLRDPVKRCYRFAYAPSRDGLKEIDLGIPTYGEKKGVDQEVYDQLRSKGEILEKISPLVIKEKYLKDRDFAKLQLIYDSMLKTPGERRTTGSDVIEEAIRQGVKQGLFGLGEVEEDGNRVTCRFFKEDVSVSSGNGEVIKDSVCIAQRQPGGAFTVTPVGAEPKPEELRRGPAIPSGERSPNMLDHLNLGFDVPRGKVSQIMGIMNFLQSKFQSIRLEIIASEGQLSEEDLSNKVREALRQLGVDVEET